MFGKKSCALLFLEVRTFGLRAPIRPSVLAKGKMQGNAQTLLRNVDTRYSYIFPLRGAGP